MYSAPGTVNEADGFNESETGLRKTTVIRSDEGYESEQRV
jgi:hypothetical protein